MLHIWQAPEMLTRYACLRQGLTAVTDWAHRAAPSTLAEMPLSLPPPAKLVEFASLPPAAKLAELAKLPRRLQVLLPKTRLPRMFRLPRTSAWFGRCHGGIQVSMNSSGERTERVASRKTRSEANPY